MEEEQELLFEIKDSGEFVRLEPLKLINYKSDIDWDKNWVKTIVTVKGGSFSGKFEADIMTTDYEILKQEFRKLYDNLKGGFHFSDLERYVDITIKGDGIGHFNVEVTACDKPGNGSELAFELNFDQTQIKELVYQLESITKKFPIVGDFNIKNE